ncbi:hypothetical protein BDY21DRAFT_423771 [Lineolata rhizophorae]|uniref:Uncharacterized protein n=1 Tax=Lineolata rhizophorae TaxID=578093 RepID=A0A6A6NRZ2_9PEZI|nr:hypothetical protein BDY21DRAFT_423771 [Lineolata rhizophorae]
MEVKSGFFYLFSCLALLLFTANFQSSSAAPTGLSDNTDYYGLFGSPTLPRDISLPPDTTPAVDSPKHLFRRGCFQSKPEPEDEPQFTCDGNVPSPDEMRLQIQNHGTVPTKMSMFYTRLGNAGGMAIAKRWICDHPDDVAPDSFVFFDDIVDPDWEVAVGTSFNGNQARIVAFQKLLSQIFAEEAQGTAWIFMPDDVQLDDLDDMNTWKSWEFPALTRNSKIDAVRRVDPREGATQGPRAIWARGDPPTPNEPRGLLPS